MKFSVNIIYLIEKKLLKKDPAGSAKEIFDPTFLTHCSIKEILLFFELRLNKKKKKILCEKPECKIFFAISWKWKSTHSRKGKWNEKIMWKNCEKPKNMRKWENFHVKTSEWAEQWAEAKPMWIGGKTANDSERVRGNETKHNRIDIFISNFIQTKNVQNKNVWSLKWYGRVYWF